MSGSIPIVRLTLERMQLTLLTALSEYEAQLEPAVQEAVAAFCEPGNLRRVVAEIVDKEIKDAIEIEVRTFYRYGAGRQTILRAVTERLTPHEEPPG